MDLQRGEERVALLDLSSYYTWTDIEKLYINKKFRILETTWDKEFELPDGSFSYSLSDIH